MICTRFYSSVVIFAPQVVLLVRYAPSNATVVFELPQTGESPEYFEISYYFADGTTEGLNTKVGNRIYNYFILVLAAFRHCYCSSN